MTRILSAGWTVIPAAAPEPIRHCPGCSTTRNFASSGKIRLNANGKRLDAWLIYRCTICDYVWNRPILERCPVANISGEDREAMQQSLPEMVRHVEFDISGLQAQAERIFFSPDFAILKQALQKLVKDWSEVHLTVQQRVYAGLRLDRILCEGLQLSRSQLRRLTESGQLTVGPRTKAALKRPLKDALTVRLKADGLDEEKRLRLERSVCGVHRAREHS